MYLGFGNRARFIRPGEIFEDTVLRPHYTRLIQQKMLEVAKQDGVTGTYQGSGFAHAIPEKQKKYRSIDDEWQDQREDA